MELSRPIIVQWHDYLPISLMWVVHSVETPVMVDPSGICCTDGPGVVSTQSAEVRRAVSGGQHLFTLGLPMFALSLEYYLSLPWGCEWRTTSVYFGITYVCFIPRILPPVFAVGPQCQHVSGGQHLFTLGLPMFALSLEYYLSLPWGCEWRTTSVYFGITYVCFIPRILPVFAVGPQCQHRFFIRGEYWPPGFVVACECVCVSVCVSITYLSSPHNNSGPVQARITKCGPYV